MEIGIEVGGQREVDQRLAATPRNISGALRSKFRQIGIVLQTHLRREKLSGQSLGVRTGQGRRSIFYRIEESGSANDLEIDLVVGADLSIAPYMRIQELGGVIVPKRARYLTIPLSAAQTAKGVARFTARDLFQNPDAYGYVGAFIAKDVIFGKKRSGAIVPLFALKSQVQIKPVGYLASTYREKRAWIRDELNRAIGPVVGGGGSG